jgi:cytochrome c5
MAKPTGSVARRTTLPAMVVLTVLASFSPPAAGVNRPREAREVVQAVCAACHAEGKDGAPKIGDRAAWTPRLSRGIDALVDAAVNGHGPMPARGGLPQLEREELRAAILYMFNHGLPPVPPPAEAIVPDPRHKVIAGTAIYFGVMPAEAVRAMQVDAPRGAMTKVKVPAGKGQYHLNISLADKHTRLPIGDAQVKLRVSDGLSVQSSTLTPIAANQAVSYGSFFRLSSGSAYNIQAEIRRPGMARPIITGFDFRAP